MKDYDNYQPEIIYEESARTGEPQQQSAAETNAPADRRVTASRRKSRSNVQNQEEISETRRRKQSKSAQRGDNDESFVEIVKSFGQKTKAWATSYTTRFVAGMFFGLFGIYLLVSFISYFSSCVKDQSAINNSAIGAAHNIANAGGEGGARLSEFLINESFGLGSAIIIVWLLAISLKLLIGRPRFKTVNFTIKCMVALITVSLIVGLTTIGLHSVVNWGGYHGRYVNEFIVSFGGWTGAWLLCVFMIALFVIICMRDVVNWIIRKKQERDRRKAEERAAMEEEKRRQAELQSMRDQEFLDSVKSGDAVAPETVDSDEAEINVQFESEEPLYAIDDSIKDDYLGMREGPEENKKEDTGIDEESESPAAPSSEQVVSQYSNPIAEPSEVTEIREVNQETEKMVPAQLEAEDNKVAANIPENVADNAPTDTMVVNVHQLDRSEPQHFANHGEYLDSRPYKFPPVTILRPGFDKISVDAEEQLANRELIRQTLLDFGIPITKIEATVGPTVTLYEIVPAIGVKIASIRNLTDDIAMRIAAVGVRIIPIPAKGAVGIEVANKDPLMVSMQTVIRSRKYNETKYHLPIALGSTISNEVYIADLAKMPHLLVAGATGQGKSVGLNAMIASLLYCKAPHELKFVMIDPKQVEFSLYNKLKNHYMAMIPEDGDSPEDPVITDMMKVTATLNSLCIEMDNRYSLLREAQVRNVEEYNAKVRSGKLDLRKGHKFLPYIVVIVDEFGDLVMVAGKEVEQPIARLAQKARAVGMHVIIATQRPSTNIITGIIKANFPARIAFKVSSGVDSKTILDTPGAQQLIGRGDMLIWHNSEMTRVQCAFIDTPEVEAICEYIEKQPYPTGPYILPEPSVEGDNAGDMGSGNGGGSLGDIDPLFEEVARAVVQSNNASTSSVQRRYRIGYNRAGYIMDQLEAKGIVGPAHGGKPRTVLVDMIGLENILASI